MTFIMAAGFFLVALFALVKSSNYVVQYSTSIARRFNVSEFIIGLTLVSVGTSLPELTNTIVSSLRGVSQLGVGNILGANVANLALSIGLCSFLGVIAIDPKLYRREALIMLVATLVFALLAFDGTLSEFDGIILLTFATLYLLVITRIWKPLLHYVEPKELLGFTAILSLGRIKWKSTFAEAIKKISVLLERSFLIDVGGLIASLLVLLFSANLLVDQAIIMAKVIGISDTAIGATIIALGTTTPELSVSIASIKHGYSNLLIGNIIGSNIVNLLLILGVGSSLGAISVDAATRNGILFALLPITFFVVALLHRKGNLPRWTSFALLAVYAGFIISMVV